MSKVTDALIVVDPDKVLADHSADANNGYTPLKNDGLGYVFMVAPWSSVVNQGQTDQDVQTYQQEEGGEKLRLAFKVGDVARFRTQPVAGPSSYQCFLDKIVVNSTSGRSITGFSAVWRSIATTELDPTLAPFTQYAPTSGRDYCLEATTLISGKVPYTVYFSIYDAKLQRRGGYSFQSDLWVEDAFGATQIITTPSLTSTTPSVSQGSKVSFDYATPASKLSNLNWIGIYWSSYLPGNGNASIWHYAPSICGTLTFDTSNLPPGTYKVWYCYDNNTTSLAEPITLTVTNP